MFIRKRSDWGTLRSNMSASWEFDDGPLIMLSAILRLAHPQIHAVSDVMYMAASLLCSLCEIKIFSTCEEHEARGGIW